MTSAWKANCAEFASTSPSTPNGTMSANETASKTPTENAPTITGVRVFFCA